MYLQGLLAAPEARRRVRKYSPLEPPGDQYCQHSDFRQLTFRTTGEEISRVGSHPVYMVCCGNPGHLVRPSMSLRISFSPASFFFLNFFGIFQQGSRTIISELPLFKISVTSLHKTSFRFRRKASVVTPHTPGVNHRCEHASCALHGNIFALFAHTEQMVQSWNKNEPSFGPSPDSRLYEHMGYKPPYIFYTNSHLFCFYFNSPGLKVPFKRCHGLSSVNFLLSIKMQIHTSAQRAIDLGKL